MYTNQEKTTQAKQTVSLNLLIFHRLEIIHVSNLDLFEKGVLMQYGRAFVLTQFLCLR